ncbi:MAG: D-2-hydroxyacid dehydrogenase [Acetobacteraceae bacterium]|nr:D-2-hydroxyacid dehydrogenase [Acetobacteraceae bacterium]
MANSDVTILLSAIAAERHGAAIRAAAPGARLIAVPPEGPLPDPEDAAIAFSTRDLIERGTRDRPAPEIGRFAGFVRAVPGLRWVHIHAAGADSPMFRSMASRPGVLLTTSAGASAHAVAQSALAGMLALTRLFPRLAEAQRRHAWEPLYLRQLPRDLRRQHVVVVGTGPIGQELGHYCRGLRMRVTGIRRDPAAGLPPGCDAVAGFADLDALLPSADWLVLACPLTDLTRDLVDARLLALLPLGAGLVNVARGGVVVEAELLAALRSGHLCGAFLDVFRQEPLPADSAFWDLPNVILCPHSAAAVEGLPEAVAEIFCENLRRWIVGEPLRNLVTER